MLAELKKHAQYSRVLHQRSIEKKAGLVGGALRAGGKAGAWALAHPLKTLTMAGAATAGLGKARSVYHNQRPEVLRAQLGM